jgi:hypothetical protein
MLNWHFSNLSRLQLDVHFRIADNAKPMWGLPGEENSFAVSFSMCRRDVHKGIPGGVGQLGARRKDGNIRCRQPFATQAVESDCLIFAVRRREFSHTAINTLAFGRMLDHRRLAPSQKDAGQECE